MNTDQKKTKNRMKGARFKGARGFGPVGTVHLRTLPVAELR